MRKITGFGLLMVLIALLVGSCARIPVRGYLYAGETASQGFGAYGYLLFTKEPNDETRARYELICDSYLRNFEPRSAYGGKKPGSLMITYWMLTTTHAETSDAESDCKQLLGKYDYARAYEMVSAISKLTSPGPVLVAWEQPYASDTTLKEDALILDMSDFSNEDLDRAFGIWKDRITKDPSVWKKGFNVVLVREAFRNLIEKYGDKIVALVKA
jgi:hypothetical protein